MNLFTSMTVEQRQARWREVWDRAINLSRAYEEKSRRARKVETREYWLKRHQLLTEFFWKNTIHNMHIPGQKFSGQKFGETGDYVFGYIRRTEAEQWWKQRMADRQEQARQKYLPSDRILFQ